MNNEGAGDRGRPEPRDERTVGGRAGEEWTDYDDTLADGSSATVPAAAKPWLATQRFVHGLLRAMHSADAAGREARVAAVLARIGREPARFRTLRVLAAAAVLVLCALGLFLLVADRGPSAEAAVRRGAQLLAQEVDRRYALTARALDPKGRQLSQHSFTITMRPGMRFLVEGKLGFGTFQTGDVRIGCDGSELWFQAPNFRRTGTLAQAERLLAGIGDVLDLGYLDLHDLIERLPKSFELRTVGRETGPDGASLLRIEAVPPAAATPKPGTPARAPRLHSARLLCDEDSGMIVRIELEFERHREVQRGATFEYLGPGASGPVGSGIGSPGSALYRRPW